MSKKSEETLSYGHYTILLTLLDREIHNASYFDSLRGNDDYYIVSLKEIIRTFLSGLPKDWVKPIKENYHLSKYMDPDYWTALEEEIAERRKIDESDLEEDVTELVGKAIEEAKKASNSLDD